MKRSTQFLFITTAALLFAAAPLMAAGTSSDDDALFGEDTIDDQTTATPLDSSNTTSGSSSAASTTSAGSASDLSHGIIFQTGAVKVGGTFTLSASTMTTLYDKNTADGTTTFKDNVYNTTLSPTAKGEITIDARPKQTLRMYTKFGMKYPYNANCFYVKELFSDFSIKDRVFFRFGLHTVSWGTGYFFSPVSDMINTSTIDVEDPTAQVNGSLNLRTQITFPGTQNCLWLYAIPDVTYTPLTGTTVGNARDTSFAVKGEMLFGGWELGAGAFYKYESAPKAMLTASGSIIFGKVSVFAEGVYSYGSKAEWKKSTDWDGKTNIFQATVGASYYWKIPQITFAAQYYYDGNDDDDASTTKGNNVAATISFAKVGTTDLTASVFGIVYLNHDETATITYNGFPYTYNTTAAIISASLSYSPVSELTLSAGPYITFATLDSTPTTSLKFTATLGGGKF